MKANLNSGILDVLSEPDMHRVDQAALELLENPGVYSESDRVLDVFQKNGAKVNRDERVVCIPREMVQAAIQCAPRTFTLYGREPQYDLQLAPGNVYYGMGGTSEPFFWDYALQKPRAPTKADMVNNTRVGHASSHVNFVMALCSAGDVPKETIFFHEYDAIFRNTTKPVVISVVGSEHTRHILALAAAATGGESAFRSKPWLTGMVTPVSPLQFTSLNDGIFDLIEFGVPVLYAAGPMMGTTGPATVAGTLTLSIAETLFGLVLTELVEPGAPFIFKPDPNATDMVTAQCTYGSPEQSLARAAMGQMVRFYGIPSFTHGGGVEAKLPDAEAAAEAMLGMLLNGLAQVNMTQAMGTLASGLYGAPEQLVICDEMAHMIERVLAGVEVNDDTLALDVIREVGHNGHFLAHDHTLAHFRQELFFPELFKRQTIEEWVNDGAKNITEVAHERVQEILASGVPVSLPPGADEAMQQALQHAIASAGAEEK